MSVTYAPPEPETFGDVSEFAEAPVSPSIPHSRESEEAVIGSVLIDPDCYFTVSAFLRGEDFYIHRNRFIWQAFSRLHAKRAPIDLLTVCEELEQDGKLSEIGGSAYLTSLIGVVPSSLNAEAYARVVSDHAVRRKMISAANEIASLAYKGGDVLTNFAQGRNLLDASMPAMGGFTSAKELASAHYDLMDRRARGEKPNVISTGFVDLDDMLDGGMRPTNLIYVGGRPGMGKTAFLLDIAKYVAEKQGKRVAIFSLEMSNEEVIERLVVKYGIPMSSIRRGEMKDGDWPVYTDAIERISSYNLQLCDMPALRPAQLRAQAHTLYNTIGLDLLIVDYVQLMGSDDDGGRNSNRNNEVSAISRNLKIIARELNIPVLAAAQLNRTLEARADKRPILSDLRDSGGLEQDADVVIFTYRDDMYNPKSEKAGIAECIVAKQRNGHTGTVELIFRGALMKFENAATRRFAPNESPAWQERADLGDD